jgi:phosphoribosylformylglycinamidine synthase
LRLNFEGINEKDIIKILFSENPGIIIQVDNIEHTETFLKGLQISYHDIGHSTSDGEISITKSAVTCKFDIDQLRNTWFKTSYLLDRNQCGAMLAEKRFVNYKLQPLRFNFNKGFSGKSIGNKISNHSRKRGQRRP